MTVEERAVVRVDPPGVIQGISPPTTLRHRQPWGLPRSKMRWKPYFLTLLWVLSLVSSSKSVTTSGTACPPECRCDPGLLKATCSGAGLANVPENLPSSLQYLDLSENSIRNTVLDLPHLLTLNLSGNLISQWNYVQNISVPKLINFDLQHNYFEFLPAQALDNFPDIQKLHVQNNKVKSVSLSALSNAPSLNYVDLGNNTISGFDVSDSLSSANNLTHIQTLDLSHNMLSQLSHQEWLALLDVQHLNLSFNKLTFIPSASQPNLTVDHQSLHDNITLSPHSTQADGALSRHVNETYSLLVSIAENMDSKNVETLDLSHNNLATMHKHAFQHLYRLKTLRLYANKLKMLKPAWFYDLHQLEQLNLNANPIVNIPKKAFGFCSELSHLALSHMPNLTHIHFDAFAGLDNLMQLLMTNNALLMYLHASILNPLHSLQVLDISFCDINTIFPDLLANASALQTINIEGNPIDCGCDSKWIFQWITEYNNTLPKFQQPEKIRCASPGVVVDMAISDLYGFNFSCSPARINEYTDYSDAMFKVGSPALIDCIPSGNPMPRVTWVTPRGHMVLHHPAYINWLRPGPHHHTFHANHPWHDGYTYDPDVPHSQRIYVLNNGSLYVDYMLRNDAGAYTCEVENPHGNETIVIHVRLDYSSMNFSVKISVAVGYACALAFFCIAVLIAVLRYIAYVCSAEQREKRKSIREILASLDQYRIDKIDRLSQYKTEKIDKLSQIKSEKFDKISAYKTEKFDKLSALKSAKFDQLSQYKMAKVDKLRSYRTLSFSTLVHYVKGMREYYIAQMVRIKENCTIQSERLRENYTVRASAFKDFRSNKMDTVRENYAIQVMKIKEYGSSQMTKLREQYHSQHNHIIKLIELMDIGNCMHIVEAECMRTESMLFDPDELNFDFDTHPVHVPYFYDDAKYESEYETAGSNVDIHMPSKGKDNPREQTSKTPGELEELSVIGLAPKMVTRASEPKQHRHRKQRRCRHKRPTNLPSFDDPDEECVKSTKKKRRKLKEKKPTFQLYDGDTTAPDTPPERRSAVYATIHSNIDGANPSSEYDTASAHLNSREVTPESQGNQPATQIPNESVAGSADIGSGHNVLDFTQPRRALNDVDYEEKTPVHRPASPESTPSTPTLTEDHVILVDPMDGDSRPKTGSTKSLDMESTV